MSSVRDNISEHQIGQSSAPEYKRINVNLAPTAHAELVALAREKGKSISEILREALVLSRWFHDVTHEPGTHVLIERDGKVREILPLQ